MSTSTPPAWKWLDECSVPIQVYQHMTSETPSEMCRNYRDAELSIYSRKLPVADAFSKQNDSNPDPTYQDCWPSERYPSDQCANGEQNPPSAPIPSDQCDECRAAPGRPHATGCEGTAQLTDAQSDAAKTHPAWVCNDCGQDRYGKPNPVSTWHIGTCDICGKTLTVTEPRDFGGYHSVAPTVDFYTAAQLAGLDGGCGCDVSCGPDISCDRKHDNLDDGEPVVTVKCPVCRHEMETDEGVLCDLCEETIGVESFAVVNGTGGVFVYHLACYDEMYWGGGQDTEDVEEASPQDHAKMASNEYGTVKDEPHSCQAYEPDPVPFAVQSWLFEALIETEIDHLHDIIDDHHDEIVKMARDRFREGYKTYGSAMYSWSPEKRLREILCELADGGVYGTSGPIE